TATPDGGSKPVVWESCPGTASGNTCEVTVDAAKEVKASFAQISSFPLTVVKTGPGTVTSSPAGIDCGPTCGADFEERTKVVLTGAPGAGAEPVVWLSCPTVNVSGQCEVTVSEAEEVEARFPVEEKQLTVSTNGGNGSGEVTSSPAGISCGSTCQATFQT